MTRTDVRIIVKLLVIALALATASSASAARPHKNARYIGFEGSETVMDLTQVDAQVRVSRSGRSFRRGSRVRLSCAGRISLAGTRIRRTGSFSKSKRRGRRRYRLRGRFVLRDYARISYTARSRGCRARRRKLALYERGIPPFRSCRTQRAKTDLRNGDGRVFQQLRLLTGEFYPHSYACLFSTNRRIELSRNWDDESIDRPTLVAPYVAYVSIECGVGSCFSSIAVRDLRDGSRFLDAAAPTAGPAGRPHGVGVLVLKANGSVAWTVDHGDFMGTPRTVAVVAQDTTGRRVLDSGPDVEAASLRLTGSTLTWVRGGVTKSATLN
jgi:hypothetical protein